MELRPTKYLYEIERALRNLPTVSPNTELKFADSKTKTLKPFTLELLEGKITVIKKEKQLDVKVKEIDLKNVVAYLGCEKKRECQFRWAITLIEDSFMKRFVVLFLSDSMKFIATFLFLLCHLEIEILRLWDTFWLEPIQMIR